MVKIGKLSKLGKGRVNQWEGQVGGLAAPTWERASIARQSRLVLRLSAERWGCPHRVLEYKQVRRTRARAVFVQFWAEDSV